MAAFFKELVFNATPTNGPWDKYNISPSKRTIFPTTVYSQEGVVLNSQNLVGDNEQVAYLKNAGAAITLDFGINTCGLYAIEFGSVLNACKSVFLSFSESSLFIDKDNSDRSMDFFIDDKVIEVPVSEGKYVCPFAQQRGGFRYMTISTRSHGEVALKKVYTTMNNMPSLKENLRDYSGYFHSNDDLCNTIWYAGAYTIQLSIIPANSGRRNDIVMPSTGWSNDVRCGYGSEVLVDGAKRDRSVWSGDRSISQLSEFIAFNSECGKTGTDWILNHQLENGKFPYACDPIYIYGSDTYHIWTMVSIYNTFFLNNNSQEWLENAWEKYKKGISYIWPQVDHTGTLKIKQGLDWGRPPVEDHSMSANCILYRALVNGVELAELVHDTATSKLYSERATSLKNSINETLWDEEAGLFFDNEKNSVHPQDGNSLALVHDVAYEDRKNRISEGLTKNWNEYGAVAPESEGMISPFISSFELLAHTSTGNVDRSFELFRKMWGYMWNADYGVRSSLIEGYFKDGSCKYPFTFYDPAYISHCHPWATGPTIWLTFDVVGLKFTDHRHKLWTFSPKGVYAEGSLDFAMTGFRSHESGFISAGWKKVTEKILLMAIKVPEKTQGSIGVPIREGSEICKVEVDDEKISKDLDSTGSHLLIPRIGSGNHAVLVYYS